MSEKEEERKKERKNNNAINSGTNVCNAARWRTHFARTNTQLGGRLAKKVDSRTTINLQTSDISYSIMRH